MDILIATSLFQIKPRFFVVTFQTVSIPYTPRTKDGQAYTEYHEEDVHDTIMLAVLRQAYKMFRVRGQLPCLWLPVLIIMLMA